MTATVVLMLAFPQAPAEGRVSVEETRQIVAAVVRAAEENAARGAGRLTGDALADYYVRRAAAAAAEEGASARSFLLALGVALDDSDLLRDSFLLRPFLKQLESGEERKRRLRALGSPTLRGRHDWLLHFAVSAALAAQLGPAAAEAAGLAKEQRDARPGGSGFSFADLAADYAGVAFARRVLDEKGDAKKKWRDLAEGFRGDDVLPRLDGLEEGLSAKRLAEKYGGPDDARFRRALRDIRERLGRP